MHPRTVDECFGEEHTKIRKQAESLRKLRCHVIESTSKILNELLILNEEIDGLKIATVISNHQFEMLAGKLAISNAKFQQDKILLEDNKLNLEYSLYQERLRSQNLEQMLRETNTKKSVHDKALQCTSEQPQSASVNKNMIQALEDIKVQNQRLQREAEATKEELRQATLRLQHSEEELRCLRQLSQSRASTLKSSVCDSERQEMHPERAPQWTAAGEIPGRLDTTTRHEHSSVSARVPLAHPNAPAESPHHAAAAAGRFLAEMDVDQAAFHRLRASTSPAPVGLTSAVRTPHPANAPLRALGAGVFRVTLHRTHAFAAGELIVLERELLYSDVSDGLPQPVAVAAARLDGGAPFCIKLRRAAPGAHGAGSADRELANMLAVAASPAAAQLFPRLLFHFRLDLPARPGGGGGGGGGGPWPESWVGIGLELVERAVPEALTEGNRRLVAALMAAGLRHLRRLHAAGLAHGDAHAGNLMYNERRLAAAGAVGLQPLCIDADRVRPLGPAAAAAGGLGALRQWADVQQLLYWNNPLLGGAVRRPDGWSWGQVFAALHGDAAVRRLSCGTVPPTDYFMDMENAEQLAALAADPRHREYLARVRAGGSAAPGGALDAAVARLCADGCRGMVELGAAIRACLDRCAGGGGSGLGPESESMVV